MSFNPLPSPKQGETREIALAMPAANSVEFQSAPLTEARGDNAFGWWNLTAVIVWRFNPLPSPKQGETQY